MRRIVFVLSLLGILGCSGDRHGDSDIINEHVPDLPENTVRLISPTFEAPAGNEVFVCMRVPFEVTEDIYVQGSRVYQIDGGHHVIVYYTESTAPIQEEPHECNETDMSDIRLIGSGAAEGSGIKLPPGVALKIPAGARIFTQSHYFNLTDEPMTVQDVVDLNVLPEDEVVDQAGGFVQIDFGFEVPARQQVTRVVECNMPQDSMFVPWMVPHMHEYGAEYKIELVRGEQVDVIFESSWYENLRDDPPFLEYDPPIEFRTTDKLRTSCTWQNTEDEALIFPREMCATFMPFYPSVDGAFLGCDENGDHFQI